MALSTAGRYYTPGLKKIQEAIDSGVPVAHEDHAVRACYAALAMQAAMRRCAEEVRRSHGLEMQARVGLNSGAVMVRTIGNDLHMDYSAVGETTVLAART